MSRELLEIENLSVSFDTLGSERFGVREVDFSLDRGQMLALVGESGSGKSLTALAVMGLLPRPGRIHDGSIVFDGRNLAGAGKREMQKLRGLAMGMVFQEPMTSLNPVYTVGFHLAEALSSHGGLTKEEVRRRSVELLKEVGVPDPSDRLISYPHELSGGLRQRVMIACAVAMNPALLICDEPTTALDVTVEAQIMALLDRLKTTRSTAVLLVTHDLGLVAEHADRVAVIYAGYIVERANVFDLFDRPLHPYTAALLKAMPGGREGEKLKPIPGNVPEPENLPSGCPFRDRCPIAVLTCAAEVPRLVEVTPKRHVRCIRVCGDG